MGLSFDTDHLEKKVYRRSLTGGLANIVSQGVLTFVNLARGAVLARLLSPSDYGLQTMLAAPVSLALIFKDLGLSTAAIREKKITQQEASNLFWVNTLIGVIAMLITIGCGPLLAWFYHEPRLKKMAIVLSMAYLFGGLSVQHQALLRRQMCFGRLALVSILSSILSSVLAIILAFYGARYWALVWLLVLMNLFSAIGFWLATGWTPSLPSRKVSIARLFRVGRDVAILNVTSTLTKQVDKVALGKLIGTYELGLYNRAFNLMSLVSNQIRLALFGVALPALSILQSRPVEFRKYYINFVSILAYLTMPLAAFLFCFAKEIILIYLGKNWGGAVPFLKILAIGAFFTPVITSLDQIPLALGYSELYRNTGIVRNSVLVISILVGIFLGRAIGAAYGIAFSNLIFLPIFLPWVTAGSPVHPKDFLKAVMPPIGVSITAIVISKMLNIFYSDYEYLNILAILIFWAIHIIGFFLTNFIGFGPDLHIVKKLFLRERK